MKFSMLISLVVASGVATASRQRTHGLSSRGDIPKLPYSPDTSPYCSYWMENTDASITCDEAIEIYAVVPADFFRWNPSVSKDCNGYVTGKSYCIEAAEEPIVSSTSLTSEKTTTTSVSSKTTPTAIKTTTKTTTTTSMGNDIPTPTPIQPGMVDNCDAFYLVKKGENCEAIATKHGISVSDFIKWNPDVGGKSCPSMWADAYVCVSVVGHTPSPVPSSTSNGIATPTPTQPGMVGNCDAFYLVSPGENCGAIASKNGITSDQLRTWNPEVGTSCAGLWANAYACVSIVGHTPSPTKPNNGVKTPEPIQDGMTTNCKTFHLVGKGDNCSNIAAKYKISLSDFLKWNPAVGKDCTGLWADTYACVGLL